VAATPKNNSRRAWSREDRRWASGKRQIIEGVISQLKDFFGLERHQAKTLDGLLTRVWLPRSRLTPVAKGSTAPSADRCATWRTCSSSSLPISRLSKDDEAQPAYGHAEDDVSA